MKRREFFRNLGLVAAAAVTLPNIPAAPASELIPLAPLANVKTLKEVREEFGCAMCDDSGCDYCVDLSECHSACDCGKCK